MNTTLFYSRFHLSSDEPILDKADFILMGLANEAFSKFRGNVFQFFDCGIIEFKNKEFITGHLVKYDPDATEEVADIVNGALVLQNVDNRVVAKTRFIVDVFNSLIFHIDNPSHIGINVFRTRFEKLFATNHEDYEIGSRIEISSIINQYSFLNKLKDFAYIKKVSITLFPSNPHYGDSWKDIDERLKRNNISRYTETQVSNDSKGSLKIDESTENKMKMSTDGYGIADVQGFDEKGVQKRISTDDKKRNFKSNLPLHIPDDPIQILMSIQDDLDSLLERTHE